MLSTILLIILVLLILGTIPVWPYSKGWGYFPGSIFGLIFIIVLILVLMGKFP